MAEENNADASGEKEQTQNIVANQEASSTQDIAEQESIQEQMTITQPEQDIIIQPSVQETPTQDIVIEQSAQEQSSQENLVQEQSSQETPAQQSESTQDSVPQYYVVRKGDTLQTICYDVYGDYSRVDEICRWNNIENPDNILYGQKLLLP